MGKKKNRIEEEVMQDEPQFGLESRTEESGKIVLNFSGNLRVKVAGDRELTGNDVHDIGEQALEFKRAMFCFDCISEFKKVADGCRGRMAEVFLPEENAEPMFEDFGVDLGKLGYAHGDMVQVLFENVSLLIEFGVDSIDIDDPNRPGISLSKLKAELEEMLEEAKEATKSTWVLHR
ncbi:hypothetical protein KKC94_04405 [Patescibacteria group bacterium]|nr:hypothetical protein [Patescibacteria group bacterium]